MTTVSVVVPMYNEADALPLLVARLRPVLDGLGRGYDVIAADAGSSDATPALLPRFRREWPPRRALPLRANARHQSALSAGLAAARGQWCVSIDADLQDPPEVIADMLDVAENKQVDVVYGVRSDRSTDSTFKRVTAAAFYRLMGRLAEASGPHGAGDFRLMSRATVDAINALPARHRVLRLVVPALGFPSATVSYRREARAAGDSKYPLSRMLRLTLDSLTGFSIAPLRLATWFGLIGGLAAIGLLFYALFAQFTGATVAGWTSTVVAVSAVGAVQLLCLGVLGEYVGRTCSQPQGRPSYFVAYDSLDDGTQSPLDGAAERERVAPEPMDQTRVAETSSDTPGSRSTGR
jgi:dolichol-phosphate mannosyltransferase